jgi:hypothetical protein
MGGVLQGPILQLTERAHPGDWPPGQDCGIAPDRIRGSHLVLLYLLQRLDKATNRGIVQADGPADLTERIPMFEIGLSHGNIARCL